MGDDLHKFANIIGLGSSDEVYRTLISFWPQPEDVVIGAREPETLISAPGAMSQLRDPVRRMMYFDLLGYLPDDILTKVDRASMAVALECRVPYLDHRLVEFTWSLPLHLLRRGGRSKWPLRQVLDRYVPRHLIERPKMGFAVPIDSWLRGPLKDWAESLLDEGRLAHEGFFRPEPIRAAWRAHQQGQRNLQYQLWSVLMFQAWYEAQRSATSHQAVSAVSARV